MARNFYFGTDQTMARGSAVFSAAISADAASFGLTDEQVVSFSEINDQLQIAMRAVGEPSTKTPVAVARKNELMKMMQRRARPLCDIIRTTSFVSDAQLLSLGLLPRPKRNRRNAPDTAPRVSVISVRGRVIDLRVCDVNSVTGRSKPFGARGAHVYVAVCEEAPTDPRDYRFDCTTSRTTVQISLSDDVPSGATLWVSAQWLTARGETSIGSVPIRVTIQGGPVSAAASNEIKLAA